MEGLFDHRPLSFWAVLIFYTLLLAGLSFYFTRFIKTSEDFFRASQQTPWWVSGLSFFMTAFSAAVFVGRASFAYRFGGLALLSVAVTLPTFMLGYWLFSKKWHRTGCATAVEFINKRFGAGVARFFIFTGVPIRILDNANRLYVTAVLVSLLFNCGLFYGVLITAVLAVLYTIMGGFLAMSVTDVIQALVMSIIVLVIAGLGYVAVGGFGGFMGQASPEFWSLSPDHPEYDVTFELCTGLVAIFSWNGFWSLVQRFVSVPTERDAQKVALTGGISFVLLFPLFTLPPMFASVLIPGLDTPALAETSYLRLAETLLPSSLLGLLCFAIFAATITSLNSELTVISQVIINDALKKRLRNVTEKSKLLLGRALILVTTVLCIVVAMNIRSFGGSFHYLILLMGMTTLPTFVPLIMGLLWPRTSGAGAVASFVIGLGTSIVLRFGFGQTISVMVAANFVATLGTFFACGWLLPVRGGKKAEVEALFVRLRTPRISDASAEEAGSHSGMRTLNLFRICGACMLLMTAGLLFCALGDLSTHATAIWVTLGLFLVSGVLLWFGSTIAKKLMPVPMAATGIASTPQSEPLPSTTSS
ncbi:Na+/proline symporter [Opitutaceae bacterium TAV1]|nr:Na+/proline symporter [Opitutaceae bacterium TAV1]